MNSFAKEEEEKKSEKVLVPDWFRVNLVEINAFSTKSIQILKKIWSHFVRY